jgi:hypothetical protein
VLQDPGEVVGDLPEQLVIGMGGHGGYSPTARAGATAGEGVTVESLPTGQAVRRYCELEPSRRRRCT